MKIALVCSHGGHLTEMLCLMDAFENHEIFFITYNSQRANDIDYNVYQIENISYNIKNLIISSIRIWKILLKEKPEFIISTGSEIAIPAIILGKILKIKTVYIESICRIKTKSITGIIVYTLADVFLVQWPELIKLYGKKAKFEGSIL